MSSRLVYINGKFIEEKEAKISIYDSALMFGDMVFEMTRSFNHQQFKLKEHLERLLRGIKILQDLNFKNIGMRKNYYNDGCDALLMKYTK